MQFPVQTKGLSTKANNPKGYALIEILLAFGISVVVILAMVSLAVVTIKASTTNRAYAEAGKIAQSQAELLKLKRDTSTWSTFWTSTVVPCSTTLCYFHPTTKTLVTGSSGSVGISPSAVSFSFSTSYNPLDTKQFNYTVITTWNISNVSKTYKIEGLLSDWRSL